MDSGLGSPFVSSGHIIYVRLRDILGIKKQCT